MTERLKALKDRDSLDFWHNDDVHCPHCGKCIRPQDHDMHRLYEEGAHDLECPYCELSMRVYVDVKWSFSTDDQPDYKG